MPRKKKRLQLVKKLAPGLAVSCFVAILVLSACGAPPSITPITPTVTVEFSQPTDIPFPTPKPTPVAPEFPLTAPALEVVGITSRKSCVICHSSEDFLKAAVTEAPLPSVLPKVESWEGNLPSQETWEKVLFNDTSLESTMHGSYGCTTCHGGQGDSVYKSEAHEGMVRDPAPADACGDCHAKDVASVETSLHTTLAGFQAALSARSVPESMSQLELMAGEHCQPCHATCGQCHISNPTRLGGGLVAGHQFDGLEFTAATCEGCHGSRIVQEYEGRSVEGQGDVHWTRGRMLCKDCHSVDEVHGRTEPDATHRYEGSPTPSCQKAGCHPNVAPDDGIEQHDDVHLGSMSCQTCHSTSYVNCYGCHVGQENGVAYSEMEPALWTFKIGLNPLRDFDRPWKWVPLRHVPVAPDSFAYYGQDLLSNFDAQPTWKYATPHTIQRITPQNEDCNACHGNPEVFLLSSDLALDERQANQDVIIRSIPALLP